VLDVAHQGRAVPASLRVRMHRDREFPPAPPRPDPESNGIWIRKMDSPEGWVRDESWAHPLLSLRALGLAVRVVVGPAAPARLESSVQLLRVLLCQGTPTPVTVQPETSVGAAP
jgi:hypothetical protein